MKIAFNWHNGHVKKAWQDKDFNTKENNKRDDGLNRSSLECMMFKYIFFS